MTDPGGIANWSITHVDWSERKWHPKSYGAQDVTYELLQNITVRFPTPSNPCTHRCHLDTLAITMLDVSVCSQSMSACTLRATRGYAHSKLISIRYMFLYEIYDDKYWNVLYLRLCRRKCKDGHAYGTVYTGHVTCLQGSSIQRL